LFVNTLFTKKQKSNNYLALTTSFRFAFLKRLLLALPATASQAQTQHIVTRQLQL